jgi:hypothetical protein
MSDASTASLWIRSHTFDGRPRALVLGTSPSVAGAISVERHFYIEVERHFYIEGDSMRPGARGRELPSEPRGPETGESRCATMEKIMHPMDEEMSRCVRRLLGLSPCVPDDALAALPRRGR